MRNKKLISKNKENFAINNNNISIKGKEIPNRRKMGNSMNKTKSMEEHSFKNSNYLSKLINDKNRNIYNNSMSPRNNKNKCNSSIKSKNRKDQITINNNYYTIINNMTINNINENVHIIDFDENNYNNNKLKDIFIIKTNNNCPRHFSQTKKQKNNLIITKKKFELKRNLNTSYNSERINSNDKLSLNRSFLNKNEKRRNNINIINNEKKKNKIITKRISLKEKIHLFHQKREALIKQYLNKYKVTNGHLDNTSYRKNIII